MEYVIVGERLPDYASFFSPNKYQKNDKIITNTAKENVRLDFRLKR